MKNIRRIELRVQNYLSHYPKCYAFIVGIGIVLFWRGIWHTCDNLNTVINYFSTSPSLLPSPWWDGPLSFIVGVFILSITGAFTSSFIGNELILSGLRGEKRLNQRTEANLKEEVSAISDIKEELLVISKKLEILENKTFSNHKGL